MGVPSRSGRGPPAARRGPGTPLPPPTGTPGPTRDAAPAKGNAATRQSPLLSFTGNNVNVQLGEQGTPLPPSLSSIGLLHLLPIWPPSQTARGCTPGVLKHGPGVACVCCSFCGKVSFV